MTAGAAEGTSLPPTTRRRMLDAALALFGRYGFAGTSLQMIADELSLTKAAIYYHFRTREQLLLALMEPILSQVVAVVSEAEGLRSSQARAERMLTGYAGIVAANRALAGITIFDPSVRTALRNHAEWSGVIDRQLALLAGSRPSLSGSISAAVTLTGLAGAASTTPGHLDDDALAEQLIDVGRRTLGL